MDQNLIPWLYCRRWYLMMSHRGRYRDQYPAENPELPQTICALLLLEPHATILLRRPSSVAKYQPIASRRPMFHRNQSHLHRNSESRQSCGSPECLLTWLQNAAYWRDHLNATLGEPLYLRRQDRYHGPWYQFYLRRAPPL